MKTNKYFNPEEKAKMMIFEIHLKSGTFFIPPKIRKELALYAAEEILDSNALVYEELREDELNPTHEQYWVLVREYLRRML